MGLNSAGAGLETKPSRSEVFRIAWELQADDKISLEVKSAGHRPSRTGIVEDP